MTRVTVQGPNLVIKTVIMHIAAYDKGKPAEKRWRKTTGLRDPILGQRGFRSEKGQQVDNNANKGSQGICLRLRDLSDSSGID